MNRIIKLLILIFFVIFIGCGDTSFDDINLLLALSQNRQNTPQLPDAKKYEWKIIFSSSRDGFPEIYSMNTDGSEVKELTIKSNITDSIPVLSPDFSKIAFLSGSSMRYLYVMNADGTGLKKISTHSRINYNLAWSPDSKKIAFVSGTATHTFIYIINADGYGEKQISPSVIASDNPTWSPDGLKIAFQGILDDPDSNIYVINVDGTELKKLTDEGICYNPAWSPDGSKIAFNMDEIYIMNINGYGKKRLTSNNKSAHKPVWSADSKKIAYESYLNHKCINVVNVDGTGQKMLTNNLNSLDYCPIWTLDSSKIIFNSNRDNNFEIYLMNADGTEQTNLTQNYFYDAFYAL